MRNNGTCTGSLVKHPKECPMQMIFSLDCCFVVAVYAHGCQDSIVLGLNAGVSGVGPGPHLTTRPRLSSEVYLCYPFWCTSKCFGILFRADSCPYYTALEASRLNCGLRMYGCVFCSLHRFFVFVFVFSSMNFVLGSQWTHQTNNGH